MKTKRKAVDEYALYFHF